ncbi:MULTISPECIES: hypothetical protein [Rhizobium]|uniref:hypothetical protein n=1 Tax=Rhizobium TaxID=379 RepID=UPI001013D770|nr:MULTISPECIES: hypothetical protein [Rhizobium]MBX5160809.1 hypothetical protein [Rhizobium sp. NZLR8]TAW40079.1 hypothetical protein ELI14_35690 [Rhizobium leguminosarum]TBE38541.1 hypothetical protein ELH04_35505 [Rhizobium leguminosarum]
MESLSHITGCEHRKKWQLYNRSGDSRFSPESTSNTSSVMAVHSIAYRIFPASACPPALLHLSPAGHLCEVDTDQVGLSALSEIIQTAPGSNPLPLLFDELLSPGTAQLVWKGSGPGRGVEIRRAFSGLFGRFFARAYLERYYGFTWFSPISGSPYNLSNRLRVVRQPGREFDLPDWIMAGPGVLAIGEAKGSHAKGPAPTSGLPGPLRTAYEQISRVWVQKVDPAGVWVNRQVKGWGVMSRWGVESPARRAYHCVLDPDTEGEPLSGEELEEAIQDVARSHVALLLDGLGRPDLVDKRASPGFSPQQVSATIEGLGERTFIGGIVNNFGFLPMSIDDARAVQASLPERLRPTVRFLGLETDVVEQYRSGSVIKAQPFRIDASGPSLSSDGMMLAPLERIDPVPSTI